jgi:hypothetical protein
VRELRTEWVAFADADNLWSRDRVAQVSDFLRRHPDVDWLVGSYWACTPDGRRTAMPSGTDAETFRYFDRGLHTDGLHCSETLVVRRGLFDTVGGFNEKLRCYEITQMYLKLAVVSPRVGFVKEPTVEVFFDTPSSLFAQHKHSPQVLLAFCRELLAVRSLLVTPEASLDRLIAEHFRDCVYFACRDGDFKVAREVLRQYGFWLKPMERWKAWLRCLMARVSGR